MAVAAAAALLCCYPLQSPLLLQFCCVQGLSEAHSQLSDGEELHHSSAGASPLDGSWLLQGVGGLPVNSTEGADGVPCCEPTSQETVPVLYVDGFSTVVISSVQLTRGCGCDPGGDLQPLSGK
ncbi:hypothetical protein EYF80_002013 [Liparis tanakae]|uniref:TGF-beta family profile domain-containing protein n=1 Tax=Liparis tanakae TaxID=230148 RepID=A0A4Z2JBT1_9TELE|nr:hypothetical protein EYF80_002013 [Liparis tanakae]